jgi:hypothetical protein
MNNQETKAQKGKMGKKNQRKAAQQQNPRVAEATLIRISKILERFRAAPDQGIIDVTTNLLNMSRSLPCFVFSP